MSQTTSAAPVEAAQPKSVVRTRGPRTYTSDQLRRFLAEAYKEPSYALVLFIALTGVTLGEALELDWAEVDLERRQAHICRSRRIGRRERCEPWARTIDLASRLADRLRGLPHREGLVFADQIEALSTPARSRRLFRRLSRRAGLPPANAYLLRHSWAALLIEAGVSVNYVSRGLGHGSEYLAMWLYQRDEFERSVEQASGDARQRLRHTLGIRSPELT